MSTAATTEQRRRRRAEQPEHQHLQRHVPSDDHIVDPDDDGSRRGGQYPEAARDTTTTTTTSAAATTATTKTIHSPTSSSTTSAASLAAARGTLITLVLKLFSFGCTQLVIRLLDPSKLGQAHIQLELLLTSILFISREGFRLALTTTTSSSLSSVSSSSSEGPTKSWTVAWLTIPFATIISVIVLVCHLFYTSSSSLSSSASATAIAADSARRDYQVAGILMIVSSWIEACGEPPVLYFLRQLQVHLRVAGETVATLAKTFTTVLCFQLLSLYTDESNQWQVTVLGVAQLVYAITYTAYMYWQANKVGGNDWRRHIPGWSIKCSVPSITTKLFWEEIDQSTLWMVMIFTLQGFFKHLLTEADRIVLSKVANNYDQGVYAMGSSYGSLAARILLQPLEENARLLWGRLAASSAAEKDATSRQELKASYTTLVKLVLYIGMVFSCIAVNYTNLLLNILAGRSWGSNEEAGTVLSAFCVYTAFLAVNGMTEAFVYGVSNTSSKRKTDGKKKFQVGGGEMGRLSVVHTFTGIVFAVTSSFLVPRYGTIGLVGANCLAMSIRALYSTIFATIFFEDVEASKLTQQQPPSVTALWNLIRRIMPHPIVTASFLLAFTSTKWSLTRLVKQEFHLRLDIRNKEWLLLTSQHIAVGISCLIGIVCMTATFDRSFARSLGGMVSKRTSSTLTSVKKHED